MSVETPTVSWSELLTAARNGDSQALNEICVRLRGYLLLVADDVGAGLQSKMDASDIVQQSLLEAHQDFSQFRGSSEAEVRVWLTRLVQRNLIDEGRRFRETKRRDVSREQPLETSSLRTDLPGSIGTASALMRRKETDEELLRAVAELPERHKQLLELRHGRCLSHAEIAVELGMTEDAARKFWARTVERLRDRLKGQNVE